MNFGETIKQIREKKGISIENLSGKTGLRQEYLQGVESGYIKCRQKESGLIAKALEIPLDYIPLLSIERKDVDPDKLDSYDAAYPKLREWLINTIGLPDDMPLPGVLKVGDKVHYQPDHYGSEEWENGIVKEIPEHTNESLRVVYNCGGDWENYKNYTSALTSLRDLKIGWRN